MMLLDEDISRITALGRTEQSFVRLSADGFKILKNNGGRCVFHDGKGCIIYENRPVGCKLYPIIFNERAMSAVKDHLCPYRDEFGISKSSRRKLSSVYHKLIDESAQRETELF